MTILEWHKGRKALICGDTMIERIPEDLKNQPVWAVVTTWSVDVLYDGLTYADATAYADKEARKEGQHVKVVLVVESMDGPPMSPIKLRAERED